MADDHEASSNTKISKYFQPRWCPSGLTHTQKRKLQRLRCQEKKGHEVEKLKAGQLNKCIPIIPQSRVWRVKSADQPAGPVGPPLPTGQTGPTRDQVNFVLQDRCTVPRRIKKRYSPLLIQRRSKQMLLCKSATSRWLSLSQAQDRWFLVNRSILLSRGRSWLMIMRPAVALQH